MKHALAMLCSTAAIGLAAPSLAQGDCGATREARTGETLDSVARLCGVPVARLEEMNPGLAADGEIPAGRVLRLRADAPEDGAEDGAGDRMTVRGEIGAGTECPTLTTDDGTVYALAGDVEVGPGTRVVVTGTPAEMSFCQEGAGTIEVTDLREAGPGPVASSRFRLEGRLSTGGDCFTLTTPDGRTFALLGPIGYADGAYVELVGRVSEDRSCAAADTTVRVHRIDRIGSPDG